MTFLKRVEARVQVRADGKLDAFTKSYLGTALWSSNDESDDSGGEPLDKNYGIEDFAKEAIKEATEDCKKFQEDAAEFLEGEDLKRAGHDFWLTRNGHGAGFWDGDYEDQKGKALTKISKTFKELSPYLGDDGKIYFG